MSSSDQNKDNCSQQEEKFRVGITGLLFITFVGFISIF